MKIQAGLFQPVGRIGAVFSAESLFGRQIDENGCVGQIISERGGVDLPDECFGQSPAAGLISDGRIDIAVADDELSGPERGFHAVVEMLDARGGIEKRFALVGHFRIFAVEEEIADEEIVDSGVVQQFHFEQHRIVAFALFLMASPRIQTVSKRSSSPSR